MTSLFARPYRGLTTGMVALITLVAFEYLAVATAMPTVARALDGLSLYTLAFGGALAAGIVGMVVSGGWSDARGPVTPIWHGVAWFVAGLVVVGLAPNMEILVVGRVLQGFGSGLVLVAVYVVVARRYPNELRPPIFAAFAAAWVVPSIVGPAVTGLVVEHIGWRWVFLAIPFLAVPAALLMAPALRGLSGPAPDAGPPLPGSGRRIVWAGAAAVAASVLNIGGQHGGAAGVALLAVALAGLAVSVPRLLPAGTLRLRRGLPTVVALRGIVSSAFFCAEVFLPLMLSRERGLSPVQAGLVLTASALAWSAGSWVQGRPKQPLSSARLIQLGMGLLAGGAAVISLTVASAVPVPVAVLGWITCGFGIGLAFPRTSVLTLELSAPEEQGRNSSALQLSDSIATTVVLAVSGALFTALLPRAGTAAYLVGFGLTVGLALVGARATPRVRQPADSRHAAGSAR